MQRLYDSNMQPVGYISEEVNGKQTVYDSNLCVRGYYFTEGGKTYDNNMRLVGHGNILSLFWNK